MKLLKALTLVLFIATIQGCSKPEDVSEKTIENSSSLKSIRKFESTVLIERGGFVGYYEAPIIGITLLFDTTNQTVTIDNAINFHPFQTFYSGTYPCSFTTDGNSNLMVQFNNLSSLSFSNTDGIYMDFRVMDSYFNNGSDVSESIIFKETLL